MKDPYKTGRFGVGFCATYHITDLPSFISRHYFTVFDPHTTYLGERVSTEEPGMRIDLIENREDLRVYADQFEPYNGMFGCDIFDLEKEGFKGTLFRFPFRCRDTARKSKICQEVVGRGHIESLWRCLKEEASHLLLFLKHVKKVSLLVLEEKATSVSEMAQIVEVQKTCECEVCDRITLIDSYMKDLSTKDKSKCHCTITTQFNSTGSSEYSFTTSKWIISSAVDLSSPSNDSNKKRGLVPFAEVAIQVEEMPHCTLFPKLINGCAFCFLPLPQQTGLPFHVNGFFDISQDRSGLKSTDDGRFGKQWNELLCKGVLTFALIMGISYIAAELRINKLPNQKDKEKYLETYYHILDLTRGRGLIGESLSTSVKKSLPEFKCRLIWSDVSGGKWLLPKDVILLELEYRATQMRSSIVDVFLHFQDNICVIPSHVENLIIDFLKKGSKQVYTYHTFCADVLMPNLRKIPFELRNKHIYYLLKNLNGFKWIDTMMRRWHCIPVQCSKDLKLPKDIIDTRVDLLRNLYEPEEGYFPAEFLQVLPIMNNLQQLGMVSVLSVEDIKERAQGVFLITQKSKAAEQAWRILQYIQHHYLPRSSYTTAVTKDGKEKLQDALMMIPFLPTVQKPSHIQVPWCQSVMLACPQNVCIPKCNNLVFTQQSIVELPDDFYLSSRVLPLIGASQCPPLNVVISHLLCVSSSAECFDEETEHFITDVMKTVYEYLQRTLCSLKKDENLKATIVEAQTCLGSRKCIWQNNHFLKVNQVFLHWKKDCYPYLCELSPQNKDYQKLFSLLGVQEEPSLDVLAHILCRIAQDYPRENMVPDNVLVFVEEIVRKMYVLLSEFKEDFHISLNLFLPDEKNIMRSVQQLACDKVSDTWIQSLEMFKSQFDGGEFYFVHGSIPRERAIKLGVRPLLNTLLQGIEVKNFLSGTEFGQHEDLCDRLESILKKYPTNYSILNEFIQNADDAQASEIVFVLDHRKFPKKKLFSQTENWKTLQEIPALCILNNRKFKDEDIKGIARLGRGGKKDSPEMIGRFGIGFNVAYHITDCPSFVSFGEEGKPENYCVFDPTCCFAPNATKQDPGRHWKVFKEPSVVTDFPDQFAPYLLNDVATLSDCSPTCLQNVAEKGYVVFRLPLTRENRASVGSGQGRRRHPLKVPKRFTSDAVRALLMEMKDVASDMLLFLHHIKKISAFEINEEGKCHLYFSTQNFISSQDAEICCNFSEKMRNMVLNEQTDITVAYKANISQIVSVSTQERDIAEERVEWLVHQRYSTQGIDHKLLQDAYECSFRPLGGIAAPIGQRERHHLVFCFLPLPLRSNHPVHINGHFVVDDSRKHLENARDLKLEKWNKSLAENVIAPCYVDLLLNAQEMTERGETDHEWFYSLFPQIDVEGEVGDLKLAEAVYKNLLSINPRILLQIQHSPCGTENDKVWFCLRGHEMGYFFRSHISEDTEKVLSADQELLMALIKLGMPITTEAPLILFEGLSEVDEIYTKSARVDPHKVVDHLKQVEISKLQATLTNMTALQLLLEFCIEGMNADDFLDVIKTVPLLLSANGCLQKGPTIFQSAHISLLPHCSAHFVDKELELSSVGQILSREDYHVIIPLQVNFVAKHIALENTTEVIDINKISTENLSLITGLWEYLTTVQISFCDLKCLECKPLILTEDDQLFPLLLANAVLCNEGGNFHIKSALQKLGYSTLSLKGLSPQMQVIFSGVVNKCSDGSDIIKCFCVRPPSNCDATFDQEEARAIIESVRVYQLSRVASILVKLQLFEALDGSFIAVDGKYNIYATWMPHTMPQVGMKDLQEETGFIILKVHDHFFKRFYEEILPSSTVYVNLPELYKKFIVPNMLKLSTEALIQHLGYIRDMRYHMTDQDLMLKLKECSFVNMHGDLFTPSEMYGPDSDFFPFLTLFCADKLLPIPWNQEEWLPFLRELGLRQDICQEEWLRHATKFAEGVLQESISMLQAKSDILLEALCIFIQKQMTREGLNETFNEFLQEVSDIKFIYNPSIQTLEEVVNAIFRQHKPKRRQRQLFCFKNSVMSTESELAALCRNILPKLCNETLQKYADVRKVLQIEHPVRACTVAQNLKKLSEKYTFLQSLSMSGNEETCIQKLTQMMSAHYAALDKSKDPRVHIKAESLRDTLCIAAGGVRAHCSFIFIKPSQLVMSIPPDIHLEPFCYSVPDYLRPYSNFLAALDVPSELSARKCVEVLEVIYKHLEESENKLSEVDEYKKVALSAYEHLVCTQRKHEEELPDVLYLPSEDDDIYPNEILLHNNAKWYSQRLPGEEFCFLKLPPSDQNGERDPPASLGVKMLTDVVSEELHDDMWSSDCACTDEVLHARNRSRRRCQYVLKLQDTLVSSHLQNGLLRVYFDEHKVKPPPEFEKAVEMLKHVKIKCVMSKAIVTQLHKDDRVIQRTEHRKYCHVLLQGEEPMIWIAPHGPFVPTELLQSLSSGIKLLLHNQIKNEAHLMSMFDCEPSKIEEILDRKQVAFYDPNIVKETKYHEIGETVPPESITPNDYLIILNYEIGEKVRFQDSSGSFVLAEVTQVDDIDLNCLQKRTVILRVRPPNSNPEEQENDIFVSVSPLCLYKILTPSQKIFLFKGQSLLQPEITLATAAPICLAEVPSTEYELYKWLNNICQSPLLAELPEAVVSMIFKRLDIHLQYVLRQEGANQFLHSAVQYLQELNPCREIPHDGSCSPSLESTTNSVQQSVTVSYIPTIPQAFQPQTQAITSSQYNPRLQPQQRRGYRPPRRSRFQPEATYEQPQAPPPPPISEKDAQIWFDQAKADYRAAEFLMGQITLTPMVVTPSRECIRDSSNEEEEESSDDISAAPSMPKSEEQNNSGLEGGQDEDSYIRVSVPSEGSSWREKGCEAKEEVNDEEVRSKTVQGVPQFPALVCFLCHEAVEKCIKGVLYAYCGLKPNLINSSALVSLCGALKCSNHCPEHLIKPIEECVMQINEHENKSRLPNYQTPPCAPAAVYTAFNANETFLATRTLLEHLQREVYLANLLGDLGELPKPKFTSSLKAMAGSDTEYPPFWDPHDNADDFSIVLLDEEGEEHEWIAARFYQTMPNANITKIERVQNRVLWRKYMNKSREMWQSGDGVLNEELLFHGSRTNNPEEIYKGDASFDMRLSNDGMWGRGNYFAVNASYSDGYAFQIQSTVMPCRKMLAAWVLTGHSYHSQPQTFRHPPHREGAEGGVKRRYDSVNGSTGGSKVYITYDNTLAYPAYLITYTN